MANVRQGRHEKGHFEANDAEITFVEATKVVIIFPAADREGTVPEGEKSVMANGMTNDRAKLRGQDGKIKSLDEENIGQGTRTKEKGKEITEKD